MGTEGGTWQDEHWVLFCMLANWTPIKNKFIVKKKRIPFHSIEKSLDLDWEYMPSDSDVYIEENLSGNSPGILQMEWLLLKWHQHSPDPLKAVWVCFCVFSRCKYIQNWHVEITHCPKFRMVLRQAAWEKDNRPVTRKFIQYESSISKIIYCVIL